MVRGPPGPQDFGARVAGADSRVPFAGNLPDIPLYSPPFTHGGEFL